MVLTHFPLGAVGRCRPQNADDLLERLLPYNLQAVFSGHFHGFTERKLRSATLTADSDESGHLFQSISDSIPG